MDISHMSEPQYTHCLSISVTQSPYSQHMCESTHKHLPFSPCLETCWPASTGKLGKDHLLEFIMPWISFWQRVRLENNQDTISKPFEWTVGRIISFIIMWKTVYMQFTDRVLCACFHGSCLWYKQTARTWVSHPANSTFKLRPQMWIILSCGWCGSSKGS